MLYMSKFDLCAQAPLAMTICSHGLADGHAALLNGIVGREIFVARPTASLRLGEPIF